MEKLMPGVEKLFLKADAIRNTGPITIAPMFVDKKYSVASSYVKPYLNFM